MIYFFRWLFGYVELEFKKGFREDFLTNCFKEEVELRDVSSGEDCLYASCNIKNYKRLHRIARRHAGVVRCRKKKGLPFILLPLKNRYGFFAGGLIFCLIISLLTSFVWDIQIQGNSAVSDTTISAFLENNNLKKGTMWGSIDRKQLAWEMMGQFDEFSWVHINKIGTTAIVEINETRQAPVPDTEKLKGKNIFRRELTATVNREQNSIVSQRERAYRKINFFSLSVPLYLNRVKGDISDEKSTYIVIKDKELPIGITVYNERYLTCTSNTLSDNELKALTKKRLTARERFELDGFEIINKTESYKLEEDKCNATFTYVIRRK